MHPKIDRLRRYARQIRMLTIRDGWRKAAWLKRRRILYHVGEHCYYGSNLLPAEPFLVCLHDNVVISSGVRLITHSAVSAVFAYDDPSQAYCCRFGKVEIHDNVYIGADAIVSFGVTIGARSIIAAGAVVTCDVEPGSVMAGVPARRIGSYDEAMRKTRALSREFSGIGPDKSVANLLRHRPVHFDIDGEAPPGERTRGGGA